MKNAKTKEADAAGIERSSGNVFADLELADADKLLVKSQLACEIGRAICALGLTQEEAGRRMGVPQPKVSAMLRGQFQNLSERKMMDCLNSLGYDIEIRIKPSRLEKGQLKVSVR